MADNQTLPTTTPFEVATDEVGGVHFQRVKLALGTDGADDGNASGDNPIPVRDVNYENTNSLFRQILRVLGAPLGYDRSLQRQRGTVVVESGTVTTVTTVTTCATVTNLSTIDTMQGRLLINGANLSAWSNCVRARIT